MITEEKKNLYRYLSTRILNDVDRKKPLPDPKLFAGLVLLFKDKKINNIQFKNAVKELQK